VGIPSTFNQLIQYSSSPGNAAYCYVTRRSFSPVLISTTRIHCAYPRKDGQAGWLGWRTA